MMVYHEPRPSGLPLLRCLKKLEHGDALTVALVKGLAKLLKLSLTCAPLHVAVRDDTDNSPQGPETAF
jgi:hypothetical protein